jgi:hypothetical protein
MRLGRWRSAGRNARAGAAQGNATSGKGASAFVRLSVSLLYRSGYMGGRTWRTYVRQDAGGHGADALNRKVRPPITVLRISQLRAADAGGRTKRHLSFAGNGDLLRLGIRPCDCRRREVHWQASAYGAWSAILTAALLAGQKHLAEITTTWRE